MNTKFKSLIAIITILTCELELSANLASALALERSIRRRKNGKASLGKKQTNGNTLKIKCKICCI